MYFVYILKCKDDTLYTGITNDLVGRLISHNHKKTGATYTKSRRPVHLVYIETEADKSSALKREIQIKKLKRAEKLQLISSLPRSFRQQIRLSNKAVS